MIRIGRESQCFPYAGFFLWTSDLQNVLLRKYWQIQKVKLNWNITKTTVPKKILKK